MTKVNISLKHIVDADWIRGYMKQNIAERITNYLLKENIIVFDETKDGNEITMDACLYAIDTRKLKKGGKE